MFQNLIFDWSGTLVDDLGPVIDATNVVFAAYGLAPLHREEFRRSFRLPYHEFYADAIPHAPLAELEARFRPAFESSQAPVTVLPHAREKLEWCAERGIRLFVLSSMDTAAFQKQLTGFGFDRFFEATYSGVLDKRAVIHRILADHRLDPAETAFVGDMTHDVETARHGGISSIAVLTGYNHPEVLAQARPDITVPDLGVLLRLCNRPLTSHRPVATVGALLYRDDGRLLMIRTHKWNDTWGIPGGKIRRGESSLDALRREIREETNLEIEAPSFVMVQDCIDSVEFQHPAHFLLLNYVAHTLTHDVILNEEAEEYAWLTPDEANRLNLNQPTRILLDEVRSRGMLPP
jgi:phosphoglycolate phosphatase